MTGFGLPSRRACSRLSCNIDKYGTPANSMVKTDDACFFNMDFYGWIHGKTPFDCPEA